MKKKEIKSFIITKLEKSMDLEKAKITKDVIKSIKSMNSDEIQNIDLNNLQKKFTSCLKFSRSEILKNLMVSLCAAQPRKLITSTSNIEVIPTSKVEVISDKENLECGVKRKTLQDLELKKQFISDEEGIDYLFGDVELKKILFPYSKEMLKKKTCILNMFSHTEKKNSFLMTILTILSLGGVEKEDIFLQFYYSSLITKRQHSSIIDEYPLYQNFSIDSNQIDLEYRNIGTMLNSIRSNMKKDKWNIIVISNFITFDTISKNIDKINPFMKEIFQEYDKCIFIFLFPYGRKSQYSKLKETLLGNK